jgi:hypothetical protein
MADDLLRGKTKATNGMNGNGKAKKASKSAYATA